MKLKPDFWIYLVTMIIMLMVFGYTLTFQYQEPKVLPLSVSGVTIFLCAIGMVKELAGRARKAPETEEQTKMEQGRVAWHRLVFASLWVIGFLAGTYVFGMLVAMALLTLLYMKTHGTRWSVSIFFTIIVTGLVYFGLERGLNVFLYKGLIFEHFFS